MSLDGHEIVLGLRMLQLESCQQLEMQMQLQQMDCLLMEQKFDLTYFRHQFHKEVLACMLQAVLGRHLYAEKDFQEARLVQGLQVSDIHR
jgi:hypothetical protein